MITLFNRTDWFLILVVIYKCTCMKSLCCALTVHEGFTFSFTPFVLFLEVLEIPFLGLMCRFFQAQKTSSVYLVTFISC